MSKITMSKLARMSQREFLEIRRTLTEELQETRTEIATLRTEVGALSTDLDQRLRTITDGVHVVLQEVDDLAMMRPPRATRRKSRVLRTRRRP